MVETRLLISFICVAEELHFGRAAQRLHIAQPALSRQISQLEERIEVLLFKRTQRKVALTPAGHCFLERAYQITADINRATKEVQQVGSGEAGKLSIGFIHSSTYGITPRILRHFHEQFPQVELELSEMTIADQVKALLEERIDVGILRPPISNHSIQTQILYNDPFIVAIPDSHTLKNQSSIKLSALTNESFILFSQSSSPLFYSKIIAMCEKSGFIPKVVQRATQIHTVIGLVSAKMGISIVPSVAKNLHIPNVKFLTIQDSPPPVQVALGWNKANDSPILSSFRDLLKTIQ